MDGGRKAAALFRISMWAAALRYGPADSLVKRFACFPDGVYQSSLAGAEHNIEENPKKIQELSTVLLTLQVNALIMLILVMSQRSGVTSAFL